VRAILEATARTSSYSAALDQVSMEVFVTQLQLTLKGYVRYIDGGWQTLVDGLRRAATAAGARIVSEARVEAVDAHAGQVRGVRLADGRVIPAAAVIVATPPQDAARLVDSAASPALRRLVDGITPVYVACLDVALRRLPFKAHPVVFDLDRPRFLTTQSLFARIAPEGAGMISTVKYLDPAQPSDPQADERDLEAMLDRVQPGWRDMLVKRIFLPRMDAVSALPTAGGGGFAGRPGPTVPDLAGLYLAGDWIGDEGYLIDSTLASARRAAHLLLGTDLAGLRAAASPALVAAGR
jgi:phytoene dehydrogenase-like protein